MISIDDLQRVATAGWPGLAQERVGDWVLRFGGGYTGRANSALTIGDPGMGAGEALAEVVRRYEARGLRPMAQFNHALGQDAPGEVESLAIELGWAERLGALLMVADLGPVATTDATLMPTGVTVDWTDEPPVDWALGASHPEYPVEVQHAVTTAGPARYLTLRAHGVMAARARLAVTPPWCGVTDLVVEPALRGQGLGRLAMTEMMAEAQRQACQSAYLQVVPDNAVARSLYDSMGWMVHHGYVYRVAPGHSAAY